MSAREIYQTSIRQLPAKERLQLASLILEGLTAASAEGLDLRDDWSEQDITDLTGFSAARAVSAVPFEDDDA